MEMRVAGVTNDANSKPGLWAGLCLLHISKKPQPLMNTGTPPGKEKGARHCGGGQGCILGCKVQEVIGGKGELNWQ